MIKVELISRSDPQGTVATRQQPAAAIDDARLATRICFNF